MPATLAYQCTSRDEMTLSFRTLLRTIDERMPGVNPKT